MKIFITGASGNLGGYLVESLSPGNELLLHYNSNPCSQQNFRTVQFDLTDFDEIKKAFGNFKPECVIHTAAISNPNIADKVSKEKVVNINVKASEIIAEECSKINSKLIFTSTDLVYNGNLGAYLSENSQTNPISLYAETKLNAEKAIASVSAEFIILRTSLMYGFSNSSGENHFDFMFNNLVNGKTVQLFTDQFRTPLALFNAAEMIAQLVNVNAAKGVINFGGSERVSRFYLGKILCEETGFSEELIIPTKMKDVEGIYKVYDVSMDTGKLQSLGLNQLSIRESIRKILAEK